MNNPAQQTIKAVFLDLDTVSPNDLSLSCLTALPVSWAFHSNTTPEQLLAHIADADIAVTNKVNIEAATFTACPQLKHIFAAATGFNHIDIKAAAHRGITVSNVRDYATHSVVQHVYALILALSTKLLNYNSDVHNGDWQKSESFCLLNHPVEEVAGKKLGIIGYGTLGQAVAQVAPALGLEVLICQHLRGKPETGRLDLDELIAMTDIITMHLPFNSNTANLIGKREISLMKKNALFINTGRGGIVDDAALANALLQKEIAGAGVDVLETEPPTNGNPLLAENIPNLIVTPHTAWASRQSRQRLIDQIASNIQSFLAGVVLNQVS